MLSLIHISGDQELDAKFVKEADKAGFKNLKGHRSVGGMRASIYNALSLIHIYLEELVADLDNGRKGALR